MCFNMLFLLLMWIKAPAKQLAQSSALTSLIGIGEFPLFSSRRGGGKNQSSNPCPLTALVAQKSDWGSRREGSTSQLGLQNSPNITRSICYLFFYSGWKGISCHGILQPGILLPGFLIKLGIWGMFLKCCNPSQHSLSVLALDLQSFFSYQNTKEHAISQ